MNLDWINYDYLQRGIFTLITLIAFYAMFRLLRFSLEKLDDKIHQWKGKKISDIKFQRVVLLSQNQIIEVLEHAIDILRWISYTFILLLWITITLGFFPDTEDLARQVWASVLGPIEKIVGDALAYIPKLIVIIIIVFFTRFLLRAVRFFFYEIERGSIQLRQFHKEWARPTYQIVRVVIFLFALIMILPNLPASDSESFKGVSLFVGILVSLGSTSAIGNVVAGIVLTYMRPFKVNDFVKIDNVTGLVVEKSLLMTRLMTQKKEEVTIPNLKILSHTMINYSANIKNEGVVFSVSAAISYDYPWEKIETFLKEAAGRCQLIEKTPEPFVLQTKMDDHCAVYDLNVFTKKPEMMAQVYSELKQNIQKVLAENDVNLLVPIQYSLQKE